MASAIVTALEVLPCSFSWVTIPFDEILALFTCCARAGESVLMRRRWLVVFCNAGECPLTCDDDMANLSFSKKCVEGGDDQRFLPLGVWFVQFACSVSLLSGSLKQGWPLATRPVLSA